MDSCGRTERGDDEPPISSWLGIEEVSPLTGKKKDAKAAAASGRRWSSAVSAAVVVLIVMTPPLLFLLTGRLAAPVVWIRSTVASVGAQAQQTGLSFLCSSCPHRFLIIMLLLPIQKDFLGLLGI